MRACPRRSLAILLLGMTRIPPITFRRSRSRFAGAHARLFPLLLVVALSCGTSGATLINIDFNSSDGFFGTYAGMGAAPDADGGTIWNGLPIGPEADAPLVANFTSGPLITSTGESSLVTISVGNFNVDGV